VRIAIVNQYYLPDLSPTGRLVSYLAEHRAALGDEVTVVTGSGGYAGTSLRRGCEQISGVTVWRVATPGGRARGVFGRALQWASFLILGAWRLVRLPRQDVIICLTTPPYAGLMSIVHRWRRGKTTLVQWTMDSYPEILEVAGLIKTGGVTAGLGRRVSRWMLSRLDHVICLDDAMRDVLKSHVPSGGPDFSVIPNFEPLDRFPFPEKPPRWEGCDRLDLGGRFLVLYSGNAGWGHDFATVLDAAEVMRSEPVSFLFVGGGFLHERIRAAAMSRGLEHIHLHPYVPHELVPSLLGSSDLALVTLADAAVGVMSPSKLHSYLAMGLPVVYLGPRHSNVADAIEQFDCGARIQHGDADMLVQVIRRAMTDRQWLADRRHRARSAFETAYCSEVVLARFDRVLDATVSRPCGSARNGRRAAA
jgi:glycosyltransferase involved in cell wall biosynthesis